MPKKFTIKGSTTFRFRFVTELTDEHLAGFQRDYSAAVARDPAERSTQDRIVISSGGNLEKFLRMVVTTEIRSELTSPSWEGAVGKGSIKVTFDELNPSKS